MPTSRTSSPTHSTLPLLSLAVGAFGIGTTEFGPMGMLPTIAQGMDVSIPTAGMLISAYTIGVMVGAPVMTLLFARWPRRRALIALMAIFTLGNLASAMAPNYTSLVIARIITSLNHGAFFGIGSIVAASLVPREKQASAVAAMFMGLTIANIGGVPVATWFGQVVGWRESFLGIALLGVAAMLSLGAFLPKGGHGERPNVRAELRVLTQPVVLVILATTVMGAGAMSRLCDWHAGVDWYWLHPRGQVRRQAGRPFSQRLTDGIFKPDRHQHGGILVAGNHQGRCSHRLNRLGHRGFCRGPAIANLGNA